MSVLDQHIELFCAGFCQKDENQVNKLLQHIDKYILCDILCAATQKLGE